MSNERFGLIGWLIAFGVAVAAILIGFVWFPALQANALGLSWWDAICRAAGITRPAVSAPIASRSAAVPTSIAWDARTLRAVASGDAQRGKELAAGCAACHGAQGISPSEAFPNLAGLSEAAIYKELEDYRAGKRQNPIMQGMAATLDDQKIADVAAYFASLPSSVRSPTEAPPRLIAIGNPIRSIAPCAACHGPFGFKEGAPSLEGQKSGYLKIQLEAFATGARHNDMNQQMREIARALSAPERDSLAEWYGNPHP
jgi:cytochrome c553